MHDIHSKQRPSLTRETTADHIDLERYSLQGADVPLDTALGDMPLFHSAPDDLHTEAVLLDLAIWANERISSR